MQKQIALAAGAGVLLLAIGMIVFSGRGADDTQKGDENAVTSEVVQTDPMPAKDDGMIKQDEGTMNETEMNDGGTEKDEMMKGSYEAYAPEKIARAAQGDVILFFHASWCPSCRSLNKSIEQNVDSIPKGVTILKTDYDKETDLKKKYGVTYQHTMVQVDKDGTLIKKWSGSPSLGALLSQVE